MIETQDKQEKLRSIFEQLLAAICAQRGDARVKLIPSNRRPVLVLSCNRSDYGAVLGKHASMLLAFKRLAAALGRRWGLEVHVALDEEGCNHSPVTREKPRNTAQWDQESMDKLANLVCSEVLGICQISIEPITKSCSKLNITMMEPETLTPDEAGELEKAFQIVFNCAAVLLGHRLNVELLA